MTMFVESARESENFSSPVGSFSILHSFTSTPSLSITAYCVYNLWRSSPMYV